MQKTEAQEGPGCPKSRGESVGHLRPEPGLPSFKPRALCASGVTAGETGTVVAQRGASGGRDRMRAVPSGGRGGGLAAAAPGAGAARGVVVAAVLQLALRLAPSAAVRVQERVALPLLPPQPANKHSTLLSRGHRTQGGGRSWRRVGANRATGKPSARAFPWLGPHGC